MQTTQSLFATAAVAALFAFAAPAHAQLLGGGARGMLGGAADGALGGGFGPVGGAIRADGWGSMNGSLMGQRDGLGRLNRTVSTGKSAAHKAASGAAQRGDAAKRVAGNLAQKSRNAIANGAGAASATAAGAGKVSKSTPASSSSSSGSKGSGGGHTPGSSSGHGADSGPTGALGSGIDGGFGGSAGAQGSAGKANGGSSAVSGQAAVSGKPMNPAASADASTQH